MSENPRTIIILSVTSDIGAFLAEEYLKRGHTVIGTGRSLAPSFSSRPGAHFFSLDIHDPTAVAGFAQGVKASGLAWDTFISCVGEPRPLQPFFSADFDRWQESFEINSLDQLRVLHALLPLARRPGTNVVFMAGGGTNSAVTDFSAYTLGKIALIKMCEFLDAEVPDVSTFIVGPGWTRTKTHDRILSDPQVSAAKAEETRRRWDAGEGTPLKDIFDCIEWLCGEGRSVAGGRNFSVVHDPWRPEARAALQEGLLKDPHMYKLRRRGNEFRV